MLMLKDFKNQFFGIKNNPFKIVLLVFEYIYAC